MNPSAQQLVRLAVKTAEKAARFISDESPKVHQIDFKGSIDLVTQVDRGSEQIILDEIAHRFPDHNILTEESPPKSGKSPFTWIVDPLDGTTNFVHRYPFYAVSVAVQFKDHIVAGVVVDVYHRHTYSATSGGGAFRNGEPIAVSSTGQLKYALLATGFPYTHDNVWAKNFDYFRLFKSVSQGIRRAGSAAIDLTHVACGWLDGFWEFGLNPWDQAAGCLIIQEAGGCLSKPDGRPFSVYDTAVVASNGILHDEMIALMSEVS